MKSSSKIETEIGNSPREDILELVRQGLIKTDVYKRKYKKYDSWLLIVSIVMGTIATALAGSGAAGGKPVMDALGGWRIVCFIAAALTAIGTITGALHKSFQISDKLSGAIVCSGKLRSLELDITIAEKNPKEASELYERILIDHADCF